MVIVSHDREFLDQLCTKIVETEFGKATMYKGNYTQYVTAKQEKLAQQWAAYEKQQKEIARQVRLFWIQSCTITESHCEGSRHERNSACRWQHIHMRTHTTNP